MRLGISRSTTEVTSSSRTATLKSEGRLRAGARMRPPSNRAQKAARAGLAQHDVQVVAHEI